MSATSAVSAPRVLVTPIVVYGLEFWEHAPAVAYVLVAAVLSYPTTAGTRLNGSARLAAAGAAIAVGALFREEVIVAIPALVAARAIAVPRDRLGTLVIAGSTSRPRAAP